LEGISFRIESAISHRAVGAAASVMTGASNLVAPVEIQQHRPAFSVVF